MGKIFLNPPSAIFQAVTRSAPTYVQYYLTARCNLRCQQCNIIYANADQAELAPEDSLKVIENLASIGTSVVLLTGGEPFLRKDLSDLVAASVKNGMHPRLQTNGVATRIQLESVVAAGANDISISLDSLAPARQDKINGEFDNSWLAAFDSIANVSQIFPADSFAALGCVVAPDNLGDIPKVIRFATEIGWWVSLVPAHSNKPESPRGFSSTDQRIHFTEEQLGEVESLIEQVLLMKNQGFNVYDSEAFLMDIVPFLRDGSTSWRSRNGGVCDSPQSYFAVTPDGSMAVCCDYRLNSSFPVHHADFKQWYLGKAMFPEAKSIASRCSGCMYGSFPEITTSLRFGKAAAERLKTLLVGKRSSMTPHSRESLIRLAERIDSK